MITLMYVVGNLAKNLGYVRPADVLPGCDQGGPGFVYDPAYTFFSMT